MKDNLQKAVENTAKIKKQMASLNNDLKHLDSNKDKINFLINILSMVLVYAGIEENNSPDLHYFINDYLKRIGNENEILKEIKNKL